MVTLPDEALEETLERAFLIATSDQRLPERWVLRAERLRESPSVAFIAAVGAVLLAKATDPAIDVFVLKVREGSVGAFSLRKPASVLAGRRRAYGYDIGSSSDRDPINHSTLNGAARWDVALARITPRHKPFFQVILQWLGDIDGLSQDEALLALAAFVRARRAVAPGAAVELVPESLATPPALADLVEVLEAFAAADAEEGARGMALVAAAYRAAGLQADVPSRNDPRRIDVPIKRDGALFIGSEVKQLATGAATAQTLVGDVLEHRVRRALLAVLRPGTITFDRATEIRRAEREHGVVLRITDGARELLHEALISSDVPIDDFCSALPRAYAEALRDIRANEDAIATWASIAQRWTTLG